MSGTTVHIGRLTDKARESDVERFFKGFGRIMNITLKNGYGFVEFKDPRDADDSVYELHNREILGKQVTVEHARDSYSGDHGGCGGGRHESRGGGGDRGGSRSHSSRDERGRVNYYESRAISKYGPPVRTKYRVIVENLSTCVSWQHLKDYLREAGEVTYADAHKHRQNEGVVDFATYDDMKRAVEKMDNTEINGRRIRLIEDTVFRSARRSRSRSRSPRCRSRNGARSRSARRSKSRYRSARRSASRSRSPSRSARRSALRSRSPRNSRSRSGSRSGARSRTRSARSLCRRSKSRSRYARRSKSRSRSARRSASRSRSRSRSARRSASLSRSPRNSRSRS